MFGDNPRLWCLPISGTTDPLNGLDFKANVDVNRPLEELAPVSNFSLKLKNEGSGDDSDDEQTSLLA